jgi:septum formation protein
LQDRVFGKPDSADDVREMLGALSGKSHEVITAVAAIGNNASHAFLHTSEVRFKPLSRSEINAYISTGEAFGKAGAYAIQGVGACFIAHLQGSHSSVMGLPIFETNTLLNRFGVFAHWQLCGQGDTSNSNLFVS